MSQKRHEGHVPVPGPRRGELRTLAWDYAAGDHVPPHTHGFHQLVYATRGVMTIRTPAGVWIVPPHRAVWIPAAVQHAIDMSGPVSMRTLYLSPRLRRRFPAGCQVVDVAPLLRELVLHAVARGTLDRRVPAERRLMDVLLDQFQALPVRPLHLPEPSDPRARRVAGKLLDEPGDRRTLAELCRGAAASKRTIERAFLADTGMTFGRWRQQLRLVHSLRLLGAGQPVTAVALEVGYDSLSAFVQAFRRALGTTPGRYFGGLRGRGTP